MTLQVPFEEFVRSAKQIAAVKEAFVTSHPAGALVTAANPSKGAHLVAVTKLGVDEAKAELAASGLEVFDGVWSVDGEIELETDLLANCFVGAVSYVSSQHVPGVWIDCYREQPTHVQVLRSLYDEFRETGELPEVSFEEFIRVANPNVAVVSATQLRGFLQAKEKDVNC